MGSLRAFSDYFGDYPFRDMRVAPAPTAFRGMEYPQVMLIGVELYARFRENLELLVVHEMAHQWWYNQVGSDQVRTPWLDEGLAEYSMYFYYQQRYGEESAQSLRDLRWKIPINSLKRRNADAIVPATQIMSALRPTRGVDPLV